MLVAEGWGGDGQVTFSMPLTGSSIAQWLATETAGRKQDLVPSTSMPRE